MCFGKEVISSSDWWAQHGILGQCNTSSLLRSIDHEYAPRTSLRGVYDQDKLHQLSFIYFGIWLQLLISPDIAVFMRN